MIISNRIFSDTLKIYGLRMNSWITLGKVVYGYILVIYIVRRAGIFPYGITIMSAGLEKIAGGRLERILKKMTSNPIKSLVFGAGVTAAVQSSSAVTVMLVGLVNSGIMKLSQAIGVIMGSNIGTTITAWILSLSGIQSSNFFVRLLKPESFSPIMALAGVVMIMAAKSNKRKNVGAVLIGFAILMFGMEVMTEAMSPLADMPEFTHVLTAFANPILGVIVGTIVTAVIQSSAASIGILQALSIGWGNDIRNGNSYCNGAKYWYLYFCSTFKYWS